MEFYLDSVDLLKIKEMVEFLPISGVTSNPSIVKKVSPKDFFGHLKEINEIIGPDRALHVQVIGKDKATMLKEAEVIVDQLGQNTYIKVPTTFEGIGAMKVLKKNGYKITATVIYDIMQAFLALDAGADYIAPYINRIGNLGGDPIDMIYDLHTTIRRYDYPSKIIAASFKNLEQIKSAIVAGAQAVTVQPEILEQIFNNANIITAVDDFNQDWYSLYGNDTTLLDQK